MLLLSDVALEYIARIFCGDIAGYYSYKTGQELVDFFNNQYNYNDTYEKGFPSRWIYVRDKLVDLQKKEQINNFLTLILNKTFIMKDLSYTEVEAVNFSVKACDEIQRTINPERYTIVYKNQRYSLVKESEDLEYIGEGGFAKVYKQKSTGFILKKLKDDFLIDDGIKSRFKREYEITKSLQDLSGIIKIYEFNYTNYSYTMEKADKTIRNYIESNEIIIDEKINVIRNILVIMKEVHKRDIIHRDISPDNIFLFDKEIKVADFGIGKDLNMYSSHQTINTNSFGQLKYCAPEQFMLLKDGDKRSDVFSLGRLINFIMTGDPTNSHHILRTICEKATNADPDFRYSDSEQLLKYFEKSIEYQNKEEKDSMFERALIDGTFNEDIENYIYEMDGEDICKRMIDDKNNYQKLLNEFMHLDEEHAKFIIKSIKNNYDDTCGRYESYDPFARFSYNILLDDFAFVIKELAARILYHVAHDINRFSAQALVKKAIDRGIEPLLEEILE